MNKEEKGVAVGAAGGAVIGGIIGNNVGNKKNTALGAIIGAVIGGAAGGIIGNKMDRQAEVIKQEIPGAEVTRVGEGINVTFNENNPDGSKAGVYFETNRSNISSNSTLALNKLVKVFNSYPETNILIEGHTDNVGNSDYNTTLSKKRATEVADFISAESIERKVSLIGVEVEILYELDFCVATVSFGIDSQCRDLNMEIIGRHSGDRPVTVAHVEAADSVVV